MRVFSYLFAMTEKTPRVASFLPPENPIFAGKRQKAFQLTIVCEDKLNVYYLTHIITSDFAHYLE